MYLGIDIGGTAVKYGIIDENFNIIEKASFPTKKDSDSELLNDICSAVNSFSSKYDFPYVGIGSPGYVDNKNGIIYGTSNLPFKKTKVSEYITDHTGKTVYLGNDANCAAYGEFMCNPLASEKINSVTLTLGTGVGGGIIIEGTIYSGSNGMAGEIGHMVIEKNGLPCSCGKRGCFEQYASATALIRLTREAIKNGSGTMACEMKDKIDKTDGKTVFRYVEKGCSDAEKVIREYAKYLSVGIDNIADIFAPDEIVLAGGITNEKDVLLKYVSEYFSGRCSLRIANLKNDAGFIGAALLGIKKKQKNVKDF